MPGAGRSPLLRYAAAVVTIALATGFRLLLDPLLGTAFPFAALFFAVLVAAWYGGLGPGLTATALGAAASLLWLLRPAGAVPEPTGAPWAGMALYLGVSSGIAWLGGSMRAAQRRAGRAAADAVRQREQLRTTIASIGDAVAITNAAGRVVTLNPVAETLTGWSNAEAAGRPLDEVFVIVNEDTRKRVDSPAARALREGTVVGLANHTILIARDGTERPIDDSAAPIRDAAGRVSGVVLIFRDVTDRRRAEDARRRLAAIVESSDDAIVGKSLDGMITSWNAGAERLYGYTAAEAVGQSVSLLVPPNHAENVEEIVRRLRGGERVDHAETVRRRKDGTLVEVWVSYSPIRDADGHLTGTSVITRDITEKRRTERALREEARVTETLYRIGSTLAKQLDLEQIVQTVTDEATALTEAQFGAFFYNVLNERGESYQLYTLAGVPREAFAGFPMPRNTAIFSPTFRGEGVVRLDDVTQDPRYGRNAPHSGMPAGHLPVRSYLAVPVKSRSGEVLGGLFFGHPEPGRFTDRHERLVVGVAAQAAVAVDNARLYSRLKESETRLAAVVNNSPTVIFLKDAAGRYLLVNRRFEEVARAANLSGPFLGRTDADIFPPDEAAVFRAEDEEVVQTGRAKVHTEVVGVGGDRRTFLTTKFPLLDESGAVYAVGGITFDMTDRVRAEEALRASEERLRLALEAGRMGVWDWDIRANKVSWSDTLEPLHGLAPGTFAGTFEAYQALIHPDDREAVLAAIARAIETRSDYEVEFRNVRPDGTVRWIAGKGKVFTDGGEAGRMVGVGMDVTDRKAAVDAVREADRRKTEFLAMLAHELRNPLAPIRNALHVLKLPGASPDAVGRVREMAERQLHHLTRLVDDLLDLSRIMRGRVELRRVRCELSAVVDRGVETARPVIDAAGHEFALRLPDGPVWVDADLVRMAQVVGNLLHNAAKYTPERGRITLTAGREGGEAVIRVRDTGIGVAPDVLPRLFDMFVQAEAAGTRSQGGLGIGLTVVRTLVEMHGGTVEVRSAGLGRGSEFAVRLPVAEAPTALAAEGATDAPARPGRRRVLVVDDNADAADSLALLLQALGHDARVAHDGPSALALAAADPPEVVFLDLGMPRMDGYEVARRLRERPALAWTVLVALTGWGQAADREKTRQGGFDHHLVKPAEPDAVNRILADVPRRG